MPDDKRCGTCELLVRSGSSGLDTWGKCPHRTGWVRTFHEACQAHVYERPRVWVQVAIAINVAVALLGFGAFVVLDICNGNLVTHLAVGASALLAAGFAWYVRWHRLFSEDAKYQVLEHHDPPPEDEPPWWMDDR